MKWGKVEKKDICWYYSTAIGQSLLAIYSIYLIVNERSNDANVTLMILVLMSIPLILVPFRKK